MVDSKTSQPCPFGEPCPFRELTLIKNFFRRLCKSMTSIKTYLDNFVTSSILCFGIICSTVFDVEVNVSGQTADRDSVVDWLANSDGVGGTGHSGETGVDVRCK